MEIIMTINTIDLNYFIFFTYLLCLIEDYGLRT